MEPMLSPAPRLSEKARPIGRLPLPDVPPPDYAKAHKAFMRQLSGARELVERELLAQALGSEHAVTALRLLTPQDFSSPLHRNVAQAVLDLADAGQPHDAAAVTEELRSRETLPGADGLSQLPRDFDPTRVPREVDPREWGLGAWQSAAAPSPDTTAMGFAQEIRSHARQDAALAAAHRALNAYGTSVATDDSTGRVVEDGVGLVTHDLANELVSIPRALQVPEREPSLDLGLPRAPTLSAAGQAVLRRA